MYNHYLYDDRDAFDDLYVDVSDEMKAASSPEEEAAHTDSESQQNAAKASKSDPTAESVSSGVAGLARGLSSILSRFKSGDNSLTSLLILAFLLLDADEDERLIILALAFLLGL